MSVVTAALIIFTLALVILYPTEYSKEINYACDRFNVSRSLVRAVIRTESGYDSEAVSRAGAVGLMQLMPATAVWIASEIGEDELSTRLTDPQANITLGTALLAYLLGKYSVRDALAAYNAGEGNLLKWKEKNSGYEFKETRDYVEKVMRAENVYRKLRK